MNTLSPSEAQKFETLFNMGGGYVLDFSDARFAAFFANYAEIDMGSDEYRSYGDSKAKRLRCFWDNANPRTVGQLLERMVEYVEAHSDFSKATNLIQECREIAKRLQLSAARLDHLKKATDVFNSRYIAIQIDRMEHAAESDPALAIGTAKELIETCCKSILEERGKPIEGTPDIPTLTKATLKELDLVPENISEASRGKDTIKRILSNLATIGNGLAELRGLYGTGHGKSGNSVGLQPRHAKLAVGAAATLVTFLFETNEARKEAPDE